MATDFHGSALRNDKDMKPKYITAQTNVTRSTAFSSNEDKLQNE
jgi:hypothetical protein